MNIEKPFNMVISGHTMCGKTYLMKQILVDIIDQFDVLVIMSKTLKLNADFEDYEENKDPKKGMLIYKYNDHFERRYKELEEREKIKRSTKLRKSGLSKLSRAEKEALGL